MCRTQRVVELQMVDMEPAVDKLEALVISAFCSLSCTRSVLKQKFYAHYTVSLLSALLCSVLQTQKVVFALDSFGAKYERKIKLKSIKHALIDPSRDVYGYTGVFPPVNSFPCLNLCNSVII